MNRLEKSLGLVAAMALVLLMVLLPRVGHAQDVLVSGNDAGGEIVLTGRECTLGSKRYPSLREAYTVHPNGSMIEGCWTMLDDAIHVVWRTRGSEERRVYPAASFTRRKTGGAL